MNGHMLGIFLCNSCILYFAVPLGRRQNGHLCYVCTRPCTIPGARLPGQLNILQCCLIVVGRQCRTCFMSHF